MRKLFVIILIFQLSLITVPVEAGRDNLYTAATDVKLDAIETVVPHTLYSISYGYEIWSERVSDQRPDTLDIADDTCLVNLTISTTTEIESKSYCELISRPPSDSSAGSIYYGRITDTHTISVTPLYREGLHVDERDSNATNFPNGEISFGFEVVEPAASHIFGEMYGFTMITENRTNTIVYDELPENYGELSNKEEKYMHLRLFNIEPSWISPYNYTYTSFQFDVKSEILNTGYKFSQTFTTTVTEYLDAEGVVDGIEFNISKPMGGDAMTGKSYPAERRVQYEGYFYLYAKDQLLDVLPDSDVKLWFSTNQLENNTYYAYIRSDRGIITIEYDLVPDFWYDYPLYDEGGNVIPITWYSYSLFILLPIAWIYKKKRIVLI